MAAQILSFRPRRQPTPWSQGELAHFFRTAEVLCRAGLDVSMESGLSDDGDPWVVFIREDTQDVVAHFARIDGDIVAASVAIDQVVRGPLLGPVLDQILRSQPLVLPPAGERGRLMVHPAAVLSAFIATAYVFAVTGELLGASGVDGKGVDGRTGDADSRRADGANLLRAALVTNIDGGPRQSGAGQDAGAMTLAQSAAIGGVSLAVALAMAEMPTRPLVDPADGAAPDTADGPADADAEATADQTTTAAAAPAQHSGAAMLARSGPRDQPSNDETTSDALAVAERDTETPPTAAAGADGGATATPDAAARLAAASGTVSLTWSPAFHPAFDDVAFPPPLHGWPADPADTGTTDGTGIEQDDAGTTDGTVLLDAETSDASASAPSALDPADDGSTTGQAASSTVSTGGTGAPASVPVPAVTTTPAGDSGTTPAWGTVDRVIEARPGDNPSAAVADDPRPVDDPDDGDAAVDQARLGSTETVYLMAWYDGTFDLVTAENGVGLDTVVGTVAERVGRSPLDVLNDRVGRTLWGADAAGPPSLRVMVGIDPARPGVEPAIGTDTTDPPDLVDFSRGDGGFALFVLPVIPIDPGSVTAAEIANGGDRSPWSPDDVGREIARCSADAAAAIGLPVDQDQVAAVAAALSSHLAATANALVDRVVLVRSDDAESSGLALVPGVLLIHHPEGAGTPASADSPTTGTIDLFDGAEITLIGMVEV